MSYEKIPSYKGGYIITDCVCPKCGKVERNEIEKDHYYQDDAWKINSLLVVFCRKHRQQGPINSFKGSIPLIDKSKALREGSE